MVSTNIEKNLLVQKLVQRWLNYYKNPYHQVNHIIKINNDDLITIDFFGYHLDLSHGKYELLPTSEIIRQELSKLDYYELEKMWFEII